MEKGLLAVKEFVEKELDDYGYFDYKEISFEEEYPDNTYYYDVTIKTLDGEKSLYFKYEDKKVFVRLGEDNYEEVVDYDWQVKYFWMALLKWEI